MFSAVARRLVERGVDLARIDVFASDREHVVDAAEDSLRQTGIGASARVWLVDPLGEIAGGETDHRLRSPLEVRVDGRSSLTVRNAAHGLRITYLGVDDVLPAEHALGLCRTGHVHPRRHLGHRAGIEHPGKVNIRDAIPYCGD